MVQRSSPGAGRAGPVSVSRRAPRIAIGVTASDNTGMAKADRDRRISTNRRMSRPKSLARQAAGAASARPVNR